MIFWTRSLGSTREKLHVPADGIRGYPAQILIREDMVLRAAMAVEPRKELDKVGVALLGKSLLLTGHGEMFPSKRKRMDAGVWDASSKK